MSTPSTHDDAHDAPPRRAPRVNRALLALIGVALLGGGAWLLRARSRAATAAGQAAASASAEARVVPVSVATVEQRDVPIYLEGLGNALPIATVTVRSQVDGRLDKVAFKEGQEVHKGDLLAQIDPRPFLIQLHNAQAALARDNAQLKNAKLNSDRYQTLLKQNLIAPQQATDQQATVDQNEATVKSDEAQVENARLQLDYAHIVSPIDGVTGVRLVDSGNLVHQSDSGGIVVVTQIKPMAVLFTLPEDDLPRVSKELAAGAISVDAYSRDGLRKLGTGQLALIDNQINQATATIRLKAIFPNDDRSLWPNEFVKARLLVSTKRGAIVVPAPVAQRGPQGTFAYLVGADKTVSMRTIEIESTQGELAIVKRGLSVGEQVVADGQNQLRPGSKIAPRPVTSASSASAASGANSAHAGAAP
jgi:multidrug efflux system membrane fusion protein